MIYWWLFNAWIGVMCLAEFSKVDGYFGNPSEFWWAWMTVATIYSVVAFIAELRKRKLSGNRY